MKLDYSLLSNIGAEFSESFYLLDSKQFTENFTELQSAFRKIYPRTCIAYSYKTNYTPKLCKIVNELGGYAEVVSDMEIEIAKRVGVKPERIIFNGPYKNPKAAEQLLLTGGCVNIDSFEEFLFIKRIAEDNPDSVLNIGIRTNFAINDNVLSRFGIDVTSAGFKKIVEALNTVPNIHLEELHCHFAARSLETWSPRAQGMMELIEKYPSLAADNIDLGGGLFGKMGDSLKAQFASYIPTYDEYAEQAATMFAERFAGSDRKPKLVIEPGSALVGDCMKFAAKVIGIKEIRGKNIATLLGSIYNINPTLNTKNPPITVYHKNESALKEYHDLDFGGFTCIESDYLYRHFSGKLAIGDYVVFDNVGSYSVVLKPPFILPNFAVVDCSQDDGRIELIKRAENFDDLFHTFAF